MNGPIAVLAGTPVDTRMGVAYLEERGLPGVPFPLSRGPREQLMPTTSAPRLVRVTAAAAGSVPRKVRPSSPKVMVTNTGKLVRSFAASRAALASLRSLMVSIRIRSAPAVAPASITSANSP